MTTEEAKKVKLGFSLQSLMNWIEKIESDMKALRTRLDIVEKHQGDLLKKETEEEEEEEEWE